MKPHFRASGFMVWSLGSDGSECRGVGEGRRILKMSSVASLPRRKMLFTNIHGKKFKFCPWCMLGSGCSWGLSS